MPKKDDSGFPTHVIDICWQSHPSRATKQKTMRVCVGKQMHHTIYLGNNLLFEACNSLLAIRHLRKSLW